MTEPQVTEGKLMQSKRQANFELLRIVAMLMIIALHYLDKGGLAVAYTSDRSAVNYTAHFIQGFCIVAVNAYVLLSGYFLAESSWRPGKVLSLAAQILFYSVLIPAVLGIAGVISPGDLSVYDWLTYLWPIETEHYWFATAYLVMYLFAPLLAAGVRTVGKRTLQIVIGVLLCYFSVWKSLIPAALATDRQGYDYGWFLCLFLIAAYIRLYGCPVLEKRRNAVLLYVGAGIGIFLATAVSGVLARTMDAFGYYMDMTTSYNHILCLLGSVGFFMIFRDTQLREGRAARFAPYAFGVYLLHEHILVRYEWMRWLGVEGVQDSFLFLPHMLGCILLVYAAGTAVDYVRAGIFRTVAGGFHRKAESKSR